MTNATRTDRTGTRRSYHAAHERIRRMQLRQVLVVSVVALAGCASTVEVELENRDTVPVTLELSTVHVRTRDPIPASDDAEPPRVILGTRAFGPVKPGARAVTRVE